MDTNKNNKRNIIPFNGDRYGVWKFRIKSLMAELDVLQTIESDPPDPVTEEWKKKEQIAKGAIVEFLSDSFLYIAQDKNTAKEIINSLDEIYERRSLATQLAIRKRLLNLKLKGDVTLMQHFTTFDELMTELISAGTKMEETEKIAQLLLTLPDQYEGIITAIETLSAEEKLTIAFVKTRLLDQEVKLKNEQSTSSKVLHAVSSDKPRFNNKNNSPRYGKWRKRNDRPPRQPYHPRRGFQDQQQSQQNRQANKSNYKSSNIKCDHCGRTNHLKKDCFHYKRMVEQQAHNSTSTLQTTQANHSRSFAFMIGNIHRQSQGQGELTFLIDSGATDHIVNNPSFFSEHEDLQPPIQIGVAKNEVSISAVRRGRIEVVTNQGAHGTLEGVLYAPEAPYNLLSVRRMQENGMTVIFDSSGVHVKIGEEVILNGEPSNDLYIVTLKVKSQNMIHLINHGLNENSNSNYKLWHERLGHMGKEKFLQLKRKNMLDDIDLINNINPTKDLCETCILGKQTRLKFAKSKNKEHIDRPLYIVHTDVCGPITPPTVDNKNYFVTFIDQFTHYTVTYLITYKSDVFNVFKDFAAKSEALFNRKIVYLYCDNGGEYLSNDYKAYCVQNGITYHLTVANTPDQNGVAERMNRTITEKARCMVINAELNKEFWGEAVLTATYLINISPTNALAVDKTPYELWHQRKPKIRHLRIFGSTVYIHAKNRKTKFDEKSFKGILLGYEPNGYKVWIVESSKFITVRDVIVDELDFKKSRPVFSENKSVFRLPVTHIPNYGSKSDKSDKLIEEPEKTEDANKSDKLDTLVSSDDREEPNNVTLNTPEHEIRRSDRIRNRPVKSYKEDDDLDNYLFCAQSLMCKIPKSYEEIKGRPDQIQWECAIEDEIKSLLTNNTWSFVPKPADKNVIGCKWIFSLKNDSHGNPTKYKARLVAKGFSQQYLFDYDETFAPVARISTFRFLLAFANKFDLLVHQMDVKTAFLNGELKEEIYMQVPEGVSAPLDNICKLNKSLYGLKQSARCWFQRFDELLKAVNFTNSLVDPCLYYLNKGHLTKNIYVILYVDDLLIVTADNDIMICT